MKNTSKKLFISVFALLFAVVAVATTSFAWFTISGKARVDAFDLNIVTGEGIEIQLTEVGTAPTTAAVNQSTTGWKNVITNDDLDTIAGYANIRLKHLTSVDGVNFEQITQISDGTYEAAELTSYEGMLLEFDLHFRANEAYELNLTSLSKVSSALAEITPEWANGQKFQVFPTNAVRIGFVVSETDYNIWAPTQVKYDTENTELIVVGDRPYGYTNPTQGEDYDPTQDGAIEFFNKYMNAVNNTTDVPYLLNVPTDSEETPFPEVFSKDDFAETPIVTLSNTSVPDSVDPYSHYGKVTVRIWLEGWDGDCYNVLYDKKFTITMAFEGKLGEEED